MARVFRPPRAWPSAGLILSFLALSGAHGAYVSPGLRLPDDDRLSRLRPPTNSVSVSASASTSVAEQPGPTGWIGAPAASGLANVVVGGRGGDVVLAVFEPPVSGPLTAVDLYWVGTEAGPEYATGDGGVIDVQVVVVTAAGEPVSSPLGSGRVAEPAVSGPFSGAGRGFRRVGIAPPVALSAGRRYGVRFSNSHPEPARNFSSVNGLWLNETTVQSMPWQADHAGWELRLKSRGESAFRTAYATVGHAEPIMALQIGDTWVGRHGTPGTISEAGRPGGLWYEAWQTNSRRVDAAGAAVRQRGVVLPSGRLRRLAVSARPVAGRGEVVLRLIGPAGEVARAVSSTRVAPSGGSAGFITIAAATAESPVPAGTYAFEVSTTGSLVLAVGGNADAAAAGYSDLPGLTAAGWAEWTADGGATWTAFDRYGTGTPEPATDLAFGVELTLPR